VTRPTIERARNGVAKPLQEGEVHVVNNPNFTFIKYEV